MGADGEFRAATTVTESVVVEAFEDVLGTAGASVDASFGDLGGNSLSATRLVAILTTAIGRAVSLRTIFLAPRASRPRDRRSRRRGCSTWCCRSGPGGAPTGFVGWSLGGVIAHAMAVELQRRGLTVDVLVMFDSFAGDAAAGLTGCVPELSNDDGAARSWADSFTGSVEHHSVDCPHWEMMSRPILAEIAPTLREVLARR